MDASGSPLDWRKWVPPEVRRDVISFMIRAFVFGALLGLLCGVLYWHFSQSKEKIFQGAIIVAALAFTMPAFATSLKLMLSMFYMGYAGNEKSEGAFKSITTLKDEAKPILDNVSVIITKMAQVAERNGSSDMVKSFVAEAKAMIPPDLEAKFDRLLLAIESIAQPVGAPKKKGLLETGILKSPRDGAVPVTPGPLPVVVPIVVLPAPALPVMDRERPHAVSPDDETRIIARSAWMGEAQTVPTGHAT